MLFNPLSQHSHEKKKIPLFLYESKQKGDFVLLDYQLAASDAEQIAVDGIA